MKDSRDAGVFFFVGTSPSIPLERGNLDSKIVHGMNPRRNAWHASHPTLTVTQIPLHTYHKNAPPNTCTPTDACHASLLFYKLIILN